MKYLASALLIACTGSPEVAATTQPLCDYNDPCCPGSPVIIDVAGNGIQLTSWQDGVDFRLRPGLGESRLAWTALGTDDAWLVLDRNGNGTIDDGSEMFGNFTLQATPREGERRNGFAALALLDANHDGVVDAKDPAFADLRLWQDRNHDGIAQEDELFALPVLGVAGISVKYTATSAVDMYGNRFRYTSVVYPAPGARVGMMAWDVFLTGTQPGPLEAPSVGVGASDVSTDSAKKMSVPTRALSGPRWGCDAIYDRYPGSKPPPDCPDTVSGTGTGATESAACQAAKDDATSMMPAGCTYYNGRCVNCQLISINC